MQRLIGQTMHDHDEASVGGAPFSGRGMPPAGASWAGRLATSAEGIYGLIIVAGMIVVSRNLTASSGDALISVVTTLLVFFAAHVYSSAVSWMARGSERRSLGEALAHGVGESSGMIVVGAVPVVILLLGVIGVLRDADAVWLALGADVMLLGLLGWFIAASRSDSLWVRLGSMLVTAAFGGVLIALKALVHH
ncbi:hypothetical protein [Microbacterium sp. NPDC057944]|uniref:hypothetical protein n=1 Tax=Microbacterium sp. NPDC057944 TaxID=3346286 RepID=UPI0036DDA0B1